MEGIQLSTGLCDCPCGSWPCLPFPIWNLSPDYFLPNGQRTGPKIKVCVAEGERPEKGEEDP